LYFEKPPFRSSEVVGWYGGGMFGGIDGGTDKKNIYKDRRRDRRERLLQTN
jgi:hypothetical protein